MDAMYRSMSIPLVHLALSEVYWIVPVKLGPSGVASLPEVAVCIAVSSFFQVNVSPALTLTSVGTKNWLLSAFCEPLAIEIVDVAAVLEEEEPLTFDPVVMLSLFV